jgi:ribonuclease P protein component
MINKDQRIKSEYFDEILKKGKRFFSESFTCSVLKNEETDNSKFAVVVSKKVSKLAVKRNILRRRMFALLSKQKESFPTPYFFVFFIKDKTFKVNEGIKNEMKILIKKIATKN